DRGFGAGIVQQLTTTLLAAACAIGGIVLLVSDTGPYMLPTRRLYTFLGATLFFFGLRARRPGPGPRLPPHRPG
ncbi:MAG TPA: hypothetical protein VEQ83_12140, partial [Lapillicoccus sp.]|nr:hypothetical protein [Lapillicoccus sp.]